MREDREVAIDSGNTGLLVTLEQLFQRGEVIVQCSGLKCHQDVRKWELQPFLEIT
jgi:hypothetical protein